MYDAIVIGLGAHGSSAAYHLARAGRKVLGLERFHRAHTLGSSGGLSRVIRLAYFEHPSYVPLLVRAWELWLELEALGGEQLLLQTGGLYVGEPSSEMVQRSTQSALEHALPHELLSASEIERRYPPFKLHPEWVGLYEERAGMLRPERSIATHLRLAEQHGADLRFDEAASRWTPDVAGISVITSHGVYSSDHLIVTAGAWMSELIPETAPWLWVERVPLLWFEPILTEAFAPNRFPVYLIESREDGQFYGFPYLKDQGLKVARHHSGGHADPNKLDRAIRTDDEERVRAFLRRHLPMGDAPLRSAMVCMYTNSPDGHFIIDRARDDERVIYASACSGHGFKFSTVVGEILADLVATGASRHPISFLSAERLHGPQ